ncbi:TPA: hemin ABC transporter substrate-binding protein, partial [Stenotrophomonas maltophilia]|nr:hemin ABC transporter substrate-binding protein [Stenotrophomonas maltophilia]
MNIASRLRLCALPLAVSLALAACGGSSAPSDANTPAEAPAATAAAAEAALPAGWQRVAGAEMPAVHGQKAVLPAKVHSDDGADIEVADTSRIIAGGDDVIAVIEALGLGKQVFAAPTNTTTQAGLAAPHQFLFNRTTGVEGVLSLQGSLFLGNSLRRHTELAKKLRE